MIGLDTNVLVRYLVQDDVRQGKAAAAFIERRCSAETPGWINRVVVCEMVWVLETAYKFQPTIIVPVLHKLLTATELQVEDSQFVRAALREYERGADFADALIGIVNEKAGCSTTVTFDKVAARRPGFSLL